MMMIQEQSKMEDALETNLRFKSLVQNHTGKVALDELELAAHNDDTQLLVKLLSSGIKFHSGVMDTAARCGNLETVNFLLKYGLQGTTDAMCLAGLNGHLGIVKTLYIHRHPGTTDAMLFAQLNDHTRIVKWLEKHTGNVKFW